MNKLTLSSVLFVISFFAISSINDPRNPPVGRTGAPGETTCEVSGCHRGGTFTGKVNITGIPDTVLPGSKYSVTLIEESNAIRAGFQLTAINGSSKAGTLANGVGTSIGTQLGKEYIRQASPKNLSGGSVSWTFDWTAPNSLSSGDSILFYFVALASNNDGKENGDNALSNKKKVILKLKTSSQQVELNQTVIQAIGNQLYIKSTVNLSSISVINFNGSIMQHLGSNEIKATEFTFPLEHGLYIVKLETADGSMLSKKMLIQ